MVTHMLHMLHAENNRLDGYIHDTYMPESIIVTHSCHKVADQKQLKEGFIWFTVRRGAFYHGGQAWGQEREVTGVHLAFSISVQCWPSSLGVSLSWAILSQIKLTIKQ